MIALITGATGGLGRTMATECARRGYDVFLTDLREQPLSDLARGIGRQYGVNVFTHACDLTDAAEAEALFLRLDREDIRLNLLLNIAGIDYEGAFLSRESETLISIVRLNIEATMRVTHAALKRRAEGAFHIINVSSLASLYPIPLKATYAASKRFLLDFSMALGHELAAEDVYVLALCPGGLPTTQEALSGIEAQGFWGRATTNELSIVARNTLSRALRKKRIYIPGVVNRTLSVLGRLIPSAWIARLLYARWNAAQQKWLQAA